MNFKGWSYLFPCLFFFAIKDLTIAKAAQFLHRLRNKIIEMVKVFILAALALHIFCNTEALSLSSSGKKAVQYHGIAPGELEPNAASKRRQTRQVG